MHNNNKPRCVEKRKVVINLKTTSDNNNNKKKPRSNLEIKCKAQNHKQKINREKKQTRQEVFTQFGPNGPTMEERRVSLIYYQCVFYKEI